MITNAIPNGQTLHDNYISLINSYQQLKTEINNPVVAPIVQQGILSAQNQQIRSTLIGLTQHVYPFYIADPVHYLIAAYLESVCFGRIKRLMIYAPPRHGKTTLTSVLFPVFWLTHHPHSPIMLVSYGSDLAETSSGEAKHIFEDTRFRDIFPEFSTRQDTRSKSRWYIQNRLRKDDPHLEEFRGSVRALGISGGAAGHGADLLVIDDPLKDQEEARSAAQRDKVWRRYQHVFRQRVHADGAIVVIQTRWHEDDLSGRLFQKGGWTVLRLPAISETQEVRDKHNSKMGLPVGLPDPLGREPEQALSPSRWPLAAMLALREGSDSVGSLAWAAQYQGAPSLPEGTWFKRKWFQKLSAIPDGENITARVRYWDTAGTQDGGAFTVGLLMAKSESGRYYIEDIVRGQWSQLNRYEQMRDTAIQDHIKYNGQVKIYIEQQPADSGDDAYGATASYLSGFPVHPDPVSRSKDLRLESFNAQCEAGNVYLINAIWNLTFIEEMVSLPASTYRDQSDAAGGAFTKLAGVTGVTVGWFGGDDDF
jgi:predicted phage terminase large subunit-like protein